MSEEGYASEVIEAQRRLLAALEQLTSWLTDILRLRQRYSVGDNAGPEAALSNVAVLRDRSASVLLKVAFIGRFSSGKSFLISGLQKQVSVTTVVVEGEPQLQYRPLLPASPRPTTSAPTTILPVLTGKMNDDELPEVRVRFTGRSEWLDIGRPGPERLAAYGTQLPELTHHRDLQHQDLAVAEIEVAINSFVIPAKFFDLPGHGAVDDVHQRAVRSCLHEADIFVYVSKATETLAQNDLEMIRELYDHHSATGKPVVWVLTGIDLASNVGMDGRQDWRSTKDQNDLYLRENFANDDSFNRGGTFVGNGFLPVAPTLEALGRSLKASEPERSEELVARSRMDELRRVLDRMIEGESGFNNLRRVSREAASIVERNNNVLIDLLRVEGSTVESARDELARIEQQIEVLGNTRAEYQAEMRRIAKNALRACRSASRARELSEFLHSELKDRIEATDFRSESNFNRLELAKRNAISQWACTPQAPESVWPGYATRLKKTEATFLAQMFSGTVSAIDEPQGGGVDLALIRAEWRPHGPSSSTTQGISAAVSAVGVATAAAVAAAGAGLVIVLSPVAVALSATALVTRAVRRNRRSEIDALRSEYRDHLDEVGKTYVDRYVEACREAAEEMVQRTTWIIDDEIERLGALRTSLSNRMAERDFVVRLELVESLNDGITMGRWISELLLGI